MPRCSGGGARADATSQQVARLSTRQTVVARVDCASTPIAAIDVDGTLFGQFATQRAFLSIMRAAGLLDSRALACLVATYLWHGAGLIDDCTARQRSLAVLDGLPLPRARSLGEEIAGRLVSRVRPDAWAEIARLQANTRSGGRPSG
jgi:hypothetical protein